MNTEDRLVTLIRAGIEEDLRELALPSDLVQRVLARPPRRWPKWRMHLAIVGAVATAGAVVLTIAGLPALMDRPQQSMVGNSVSPTIFDPPSLLVFGDPPSGWTPLDTNQHPRGLQEVTTQVDRARQDRRWLLAYVPPSQNKSKWRIDFLKIEVITGQATLESLRHDLTVNSREKIVPVRVGNAEYHQRSRDGTSALVIWQPFPGMVILIQSNALAMEQLFAVTRGITVKGT